MKTKLHFSIFRSWNKVLNELMGMSFIAKEEGGPYSLQLYILDHKIK